MGARHTQVVVIGGGQAGLAAGYHLRRLGLDFVILDAQAEPDGAWDSLHLFSPASFSSLPGRLMPPQQGEEYPDAGHVVAYLRDYEKRYELDVRRPVRVLGVHRDGQLLRVKTDSGTWHARAVISATGTWWRPFLPSVPGRGDFDGVEWADGTRAEVDAIIWCTGFQPALSHLAPLRLRGRRGHITTVGTRAVDEPHLHLLGYGDWTGPASATLIGVGRPAREGHESGKSVPIG